MYLDDIKIGTELVTEPVLIEKEKMMDFSRNYDPLRVHWDEEYAKSTRYGDLVAPGVMTFMSVWTKVLESGFFGDEMIAGKSCKIEWHEPVYADDVVTGKCRVTDIRRRNRYNGILDMVVEVYNQHGTLVLSNVTEVYVKYRVEE